MKKLLIILVISLTIFACTSDSPEDVSDLCLKPIGLEANNLTNTTVTLNWQSAVETSEFEVEYGTSGFSQGSGTTVTTSTSSYNLSDLSPLTPYSFYVNLFCNETDNYSDWAGPFEFATLGTNPLCDEPTNLQVLNNSSAIGPNHVSLRWDDYNNIGSQIQYGLQGFVFGTGTIQSEGDNIEDGFGTIENLNSATAYEFYVRNNCNDNGYSDWDGPITATTIE